VRAILHIEPSEAAAVFHLQSIPQEETMTDKSTIGRLFLLVIVLIILLAIVVFGTAWGAW